MRRSPLSPSGRKRPLLGKAIPAENRPEKSLESRTLDRTPQATARVSSARRAAERLRKRRSEPGYREWHAPLRGECAVCGTEGKLTRHHVVRESDVREAGGDPWDLDNAIPLGHHFLCRCHRHHHDRFELIPPEKIPRAAIAFAVFLLGWNRAADYLILRYTNSHTEGPKQ